jgi:5'(3')-deoxyribonucleotidase
MKVIGITLDEVLRDFLGHLSYAVAKIREEDEYVVTEGEVTEFDLVKYFKFKSKEEMYDLFYKEASLEIFGHPDQLHDRIINKLNLLYMDLIDE